MSEKKSLIQRLNDLRRKLRINILRKQRLQLLILLVVLVALPVGVYLTSQIVRYRGRAQVVPVSLYIAPSNQTLPPDGNFQVMLDAGSETIGFVRIELAFDNTKINLAGEVQTTPSLATVIEKTARADANNTGNVVIVLGLATANQANPPTGVFEIANFSMTAITQNPNENTSISFNDAGIQIVDMTPQGLTFSSASSNLTLNSTVAPTARLYFSGPRPANPQTVSSSFDIDVLLDTGGQDVDGIDARVSFDTSFLSVSNLVNNPASVF